MRDEESLLSFFFFSSRRRHTRLQGDWSSDVCSSDLVGVLGGDPLQVPGQLVDVAAQRGQFGAERHRLGPAVRLSLDDLGLSRRAGILDTKSGVQGKRGDFGGGRIIKKKKRRITIPLT